MTEMNYRARSSSTQQLLFVRPIDAKKHQMLKNLVLPLNIEYMVLADDSVRLLSRLSSSDPCI